MGAVLDIAQLVSLFWTSFARRFLSPTPRQIIERTAPPTFDYASYYNYFLFYTTIALSFATLQPIILIVAFLYFQVDSWLKKYLLMYVFVSKVESGGAFWRLLFNRFLFAAAFSNLIVGIVVWVQYDASYACFWVIPLPIFLIGFKWYCRRKFDDAMHFHTKGSDRESIIAAAGGKIASSRNDKLRTRFGNPALYRPLIVPMVHKKAQHVLAKVYQGRLNSERIIPSMYGDVDLDMMQSGGKAGRPMRPLDGQFKLVEENELYFENWKGRDEFMGGHAGGEMYNQGYGYESGLNTPSGLPHEYGGGSPSSLRAATPADFTRGGNPDYHLNLPGAASFNSRPNSPQMRPRSGLGISTYHAGYDPVPLGSSSQPGTPHFAPLGSPGFAPVPYSQQYQQHPHHQSQLHSRGPSPNPLQNLDVQSIRSGYSDGASSSHYQQPYIQQQQPHQPHQFPQQQYHDPQPQPQPQQGYPFQPADTMRENLIPGLPHLPPPGQGQGSGGGYEEFRKGGF